MAWICHLRTMLVRSAAHQRRRSGAARRLRLLTTALRGSIGTCKLRRDDLRWRHIAVRDYRRMTIGLHGVERRVLEQLRYSYSTIVREVRIFVLAALPPIADARSAVASDDDSRFNDDNSFLIGSLHLVADMSMCCMRMGLSRDCIWRD